MCCSALVAPLLVAVLRCRLWQALAALVQVARCWSLLAMLLGQLMLVVRCDFPLVRRALSAVAAMLLSLQALVSWWVGQ